MRLAVCNGFTDYKITVDKIGISLQGKAYPAKPATASTMALLSIVKSKLFLRTNSMRISFVLLAGLVMASPAYAQHPDDPAVQICENEARQSALKRIPSIALADGCDTAACLNAHRGKLQLWATNLGTWAADLPASCMKDAYLSLSKEIFERADMIKSLVGDGDIPTPPKGLLPQ